VLSAAARSGAPGSVILAVSSDHRDALRRPNADYNSIRDNRDGDVNDASDDCHIAICPSNDPSCQDCNANGIPDGCDIASSLSLDEDEDGIPDECENLLNRFEGFGNELLDSGPCVGLSPDPCYDDPTCAAAWEEFYDWSLAQTWEPNSPLTGAEQFQVMLDKLAEIGLPTPYAMP
jgi:hypothetical protein